MFRTVVIRMEYDWSSNLEAARSLSTSLRNFLSNLPENLLFCKYVIYYSSNKLGYSHVLTRVPDQSHKNKLGPDLTVKNTPDSDLGPMSAI